MKICSSCKSSNPDDAKYCHMCGAKTSGTKEFSLTLVWIVLVICVIVGTCVLILRGCNHQDSVIPSSYVSRSPTEQVKYIVQDLCDAILNHDYFRIEQLYANNVSRYHNKQNLSNGEVVEMHRKYDQQFGVYNKSISVRWDTFQASWRDYDGHTTITYIMGL